MSDDLGDVEKGMLEGLVKGKKAAKGKPVAKQAKRAKIDRSKLLQDKLEADVMGDVTLESAVEAVVETTVTEHTVVSGDTLSGIAQKYYGSQRNWKAIYQANKETIGDNPSLIRVGQLLKIPKLD